MKVPATLTPVQPADMLDALVRAYVEGLGHSPTHTTLATIYAQIALETANGAKVVQWNVGNYKRGPGPNYCDFTTFEYVGEPRMRKVLVCEFSAWPDLESALNFYLSALWTHWPEAWSAAVHGDPEGFALGLHVRGYYTAPVQAYASGMRAWYDYAMKRLGGEPEPAEPPFCIDPSGAAIMAIDGLLTPSSG